jgi:hypothetical protein
MILFGKICKKRTFANPNFKGLLSGCTWEGGSGIVTELNGLLISDLQIFVKGLCDITQT